ncbi:MAG: hypothetical protein CMG71_02510 [Candidatus Marinimicrobia bacterium]|nr:hypothetical protein [Candidatus Neomarinimicrobiota bacterium]|tara:strand:+ start:5772 stop:7109 length:1338 start_codon:yes stop_codon:yes gene_type:complete
MNNQKQKWTREMDDSEKDSISIITCDMEGRIDTFAKGAEDIFGYTADELVGKKRVSVFSPGNVVLGHINKWLATAREKGEFQTDTTFLHKDGSQIPAYIRITPTFSTIDGEKTQIGYCGQTRVLKGADPAETMPKNPWWLKMLSALVITRFPFLSATWIPVILASVWAYNGGVATGAFNFSLFGVVFLGASFLHLAANTFNDYFDWKAGTDQANNDYFLQYSGGSRALELGIITENGLFRLASSFLILAAVCGVAVMFGPWVRGIDLLWYGLAGAVGGLFYSSPPFKLSARRGLGELSIGLLFGPVMTMGTVFALTGIHNWSAFWLGIPVGLLTTAILWVNQFPDTPSDIATGKVHLVATLGTKNARWGYFALMAGSFVALTVLHTYQIVAPGALLGLVALPGAAYLTFKVFQDYEKRTLAKTCANTIYFQMVTGTLMILGISFL